MQTHDFSQLPVFEAGAPVGAVYEDDILTLVLEGKDLKKLVVREVMGGAFPVVSASATIEQITTAHFARVPRFRDRYMPAEWTGRTFKEANLGLTRQDAVAEACRCFNCGVCNSCEVCLIFCPDIAITRRGDGGFQISYKYCKGCGVCAAECPRCAMAMTREGL